MAGIIGIYGLVVSVLISDGLKQELPLYTGFIQLGAGLSVGLAGLAAGWAMFMFCRWGGGKYNKLTLTQLCHWYCRRCRCAWYCTATTVVRRHDFDPDFRWSFRYVNISCSENQSPLFENSLLMITPLRSLWSYRCASDELKRLSKRFMQL